MLPPAPSRIAPPEPAWKRALRLRSQGLNQKYGLGPPKKPAYVTPPDAIVGNAGQGGQFSGGIGTGTTDTSDTDTSDTSDTSGASKTIGIPGYTPDYAALIAADPELITGLADLDNYRGGLKDARRNAIRTAVIRAGFHLPNPVEDIDAATIAAADQNPFSQAHELDVGKTHQTTDLDATLAARGILSSGALTGGTQKIQTDYDRGVSQGTNALLDFITGAIGDFTTKDAQAITQGDTIKTNAATRVQGNPLYQPIAPGTATLDPASGLYVTADGRWYNADGTPASAPPPSSSSSTGSGSDTTPPPEPPIYNPPPPPPPPPVYEPPYQPNVGATTNPLTYRQLGRKMDPRFDL